MPFKSKKQETYLRINEPEIHKRWVKNYGHYAAEETAWYSRHGMRIKGFPEPYYRKMGYVVEHPDRGPEELYEIRPTLLRHRWEDVEGYFIPWWYWIDEEEEPQTGGKSFYTLDEALLWLKANPDLAPGLEWEQGHAENYEGKGEWDNDCSDKPYEHSTAHDDWAIVKDLTNLHDWTSSWDYPMFDYCGNCGQYYSPETGIVTDEEYQDLIHGANAESFAADSSERCFACGCAGDGKGDNPGRNELIYCELCEDSWCDCCREPSCADKHEWYFCTRNAAESFSAEEYNFQLVFSTYNRNSQSCIKSKDYGGGICGLNDRYGNRRGSYGSSGMSEPTCPHCKKVWNNMSNQDKDTYTAESFSADMTQEEINSRLPENICRCCYENMWTMDGYDFMCVNCEEQGTCENCSCQKCNVKLEDCKCDTKQCSVCGDVAIHVLKKEEIVLCDKHYQQQFGKYSAESFGANDKGWRVGDLIKHYPSIHWRKGGGHEGINEDWYNVGTIPITTDDGRKVVDFQSVGDVRTFEISKDAYPEIGKASKEGHEFWVRYTELEDKYRKEYPNYKHFIANKQEIGIKDDNEGKIKILWTEPEDEWLKDLWNAESFSAESKVYQIPCYWSVSMTIPVEAESLDEACEKAYTEIENHDMSKADYLEDSFEPDYWFARDLNEEDEE